MNAHFLIRVATLEPRGLDPPPLFRGDLEVEEAEDDLAEQLGLVRRSDAKKRELVEAHHPHDGAGLFREWEYHGACAAQAAGGAKAGGGDGGGGGSERGTVVTDSWGRLSWAATGGRLLRQRCAWTLRPTLYRQGGYFRSTRAPVTVRLSSLNLGASEVLELWEPHQPTATAADTADAAAQGTAATSGSASSGASDGARRAWRLLAAFKGERVVEPPYPQACTRHAHENSMGWHVHGMCVAAA